MATTVRYTVADGELFAEKRTGARYAYVPDPLGSVVAKLNASQAKTDTFEYWPYGETSDLTQSTPTPYRFLGTLGYYADQSGLTYVRARYLKKEAGRFTTEAPVGEQLGGEHPYGYAFNNPIIQIDPLGLSPFACGVNCHTHSDGACGYAKSIKADKGDGGGVVCCDGIKSACYWGLVDRLVAPHIGLCTKVHETCHKPSVTCTRPGFYRPGFNKNVNPSSDECKCHQADIACLKKHINNCKPPFKDLCLRLTKARIKQQCSNAKENCNDIKKNIKC